MELLPGALLALLLLLDRIGDKSAAQFMWNDASSLGFMLTAAAWLSALRALVEGKWNFRFDARRAAGWFALIVLALMQPYLDAQIASVIPAGDGYGRVLILLLTVLCGGCLIPFLRKDRSAGIMTAAAGAVMLLLYFLLTRTELAQSAGTMGSLLMLLAGDGISRCIWDCCSAVRGVRWAKRNKRKKKDTALAVSFWYAKGKIYTLRMCLAKT